MCQPHHDPSLPEHHIRVDGPSPKGTYLVREVLQHREIKRYFRCTRDQALLIAEGMSKEYVVPVIDKTKG